MGVWREDGMAEGPGRRWRKVGRMEERCMGGEGRLRGARWRKDGRVEKLSGERYVEELRMGGGGE